MLRQRTPTAAAIFSEALADLAFMFADVDVPAAPGGESWLETTVGYQGPAGGSLRFLCPRGFARLLSANLLAVDPDDPATDAGAADAAKELMNIVCGRLVTALHGSERLVEISIPECRQLSSPPDLDAAGGPECCTLAVEGYPVRLIFTPDQRSESLG